MRGLYDRLGGYGAWSQIARAAGLRSSTVSRIARGEVKPSLESWEKLHEAYPSDIPPPSLEGGRRLLVLVPEESGPEEPGPSQ